MIFELCFNPLPFFLIFFLSFFAWIYIVIVHINILNKLHDQQPELYVSILNEREISWIERGYFVPSDISIAWNLHKSIWLDKKILANTNQSLRSYKIAALIFVFGLSISSLSAIIFFACAFMHAKI